MTRGDLRILIEEIGIVPNVRPSSTADAVWTAATLRRGGLPLVEVTIAGTATLDALSELARGDRDCIVGAGNVMDVEMARCCVDRGARFLASPGLDPDIVRLAVENDIVVIPGVLTPTEVMSAWRLRPDFLKVFPCSQVGGASQIRAFQGPFPQVPFLAAGGVTQTTAAQFIQAGAVALCLGAELLPGDAIYFRDENRVLELARRFLSIIRQARKASAPEIRLDPARPSLRPRSAVVLA